MLKLDSLYKSFEDAEGPVRVLVDASWQLGKGESAALLGESGSGKSTLLALIAGLDRPDDGRIFIDGREASAFSDSQWNALRRESLGLVFQQYHLVPTLTVSDNIYLQARLAGHVDRDFGAGLVEQLGIGHLLSRLPHQLSGGQQQRVAIARALMHEPSLVLADEPTGNLDEDTSRAVMKLLCQLVGESGASLIMVTHSREMASYLDSRWQLHHGQITALDQ